MGQAQSIRERERGKRYKGSWGTNLILRAKGDAGRSKPGGAPGLGDLHPRSASPINLIRYSGKRLSIISDNFPPDWLASPSHHLSLASFCLSAPHADFARMLRYIPIGSSPALVRFMQRSSIFVAGSPQSHMETALPRRRCGGRRGPGRPRQASRNGNVSFSYASRRYIRVRTPARTVGAPRHRN